MKREVREFIKSEIRVYMRMLRDMEMEMHNPTTIHRLKAIVVEYGATVNMIKSLVENRTLVGVSEELEEFKMQREQEFKPFYFSFTQIINYHMADALRLWHIYYKHVYFYRSYDQIGVFLDLKKEDSYVQPRCRYCGEIVLPNRDGKHYCSAKCRLAAVDSVRHRKLLRERLAATRSKQSWWRRLINFVRNIGKKSNYKLAA